MKRLAQTLMIIIAITMSSYAQTGKEVREQEQAIQKIYVDSVLNSKHYIFFADRVTTSLPKMPYVNIASDNYFFKVDGDTVISELPFYGKSTSANYGSANSPLSYTSNSVTYKTKIIKKKKYENTLIEIHAVPTKMDVNNFDITIEVSANGSATMNVRGTNLSNISFSGRIERTKN